MARFSDIIEQDHIKEHMQNAIKTGKISHAYIISGDAGSGKKMIANTFAKMDFEDTECYIEVSNGITF